jgi:lysozyme family protein
MAVSFSPQLKNEYQGLFDRCTLRPARRAEVEAAVGRIEAGRPRYAKVAKQVGIPWYVVGIIHNMEASLRFDRHLHNGDPLTARTKNWPPGRPKAGNPPFTWEASAVDALRLTGMDKWTDWSIPGTLFKLEGYNGFGYRQHHPDVLSPYLWSFSNHYQRGKYVADGRWSATAVSAQCGAAVILRRMAEKGLLDAKAVAAPQKAGAAKAGAAKAGAAKAGAGKPLLRYSNTPIPHGEELQRFLNTLPGIFVAVDGAPGEKSSDAFRAVTGRYLAGDPRAAAAPKPAKKP